MLNWNFAMGGVGWGGEGGLGCLTHLLPKFIMRFVKLPNNSTLHKNFMKNVSNNLRKSKIFILKY